MRALDLFCGAGGISVGLARAGFDVVGVDLNPKVEPYWRKGMEPYGGEFYCADALAFDLSGFDLICASPPCQAHTVLRRLNPGREYPDLIPATRERLQASGIPWCIENVPGAPLGGANLIMLCGTMFGLQTRDGRAELRRHRLFETSFSIPLRPACQHGHVSMESLSVCGTGMGPGNRGKEAGMKKRRAISVVGNSAEMKLEGWTGRREVIGITGTGNPTGSLNSHRPKVLTVVGHTPVDNTGRATITVSGDRPNSANTPRVICVAGGAMSGGMMTPQGELRRRALERLASRPSTISVTGSVPQQNIITNQARETFSTDDARTAMGIDWMPMRFLSQAIPPAYGEWIGRQALAHLAGLRQ